MAMADKTAAIKNTLKGKVAAVDTAINATIELENAFWSVKGDASKEIFEDVHLKVRGDFNKNKVMGAGGDF